MVATAAQSPQTQFSQEFCGQRLQQRQNSPDANWALTGILWPVVATAAESPETNPVLTGILQNNYYALSA